MCTPTESESFRIPLFLKIFNAILLVLQCLFLITLIAHWYIYIFYIAIVTFLAAIGQIAVLKRNKRLLYVYGIYLAIYFCWSTGMIMGLAMGLLWDWNATPDNSTTVSTVEPNSLNGLEMAGYIMGMTLDLVSMVLTLVILRLLFVMLKMMKRQRRSSEPIVTYATRLPGAPPRYTPTSPDSIPSSPTASPIGPSAASFPLELEAEPLPVKENLPDRRESLPPAYCPSDPAPRPQ